jgi:2-methylcitrate dehydratase
VRRPELVRLWHKVQTLADPEWTKRFRDRTSLDKAHGGRVVVVFRDGTRLEDEIDVPDAHPRGARPFGHPDYVRKFETLTEGIVGEGERRRFLDEAGRLGELDAAAVHRLGVVADLLPAPAHPTRGLFDAERLRL